MIRVLGAMVVAAALASVAGCGGSSSAQTTGGGSSAGGGGTASANVQAIKVYAGPAGNYANGAFTSVTVCNPGTTDCQTIDGVLLDTGSSGLRLLSSYAGGALTLALPQLYQSDGNPLAECAQYADFSFTWGSVRRADVRLAGELAQSVSVNVLGDSNFPVIPRECSYSNIDNDSLRALGANGILGVGTFRQDCGTACASGSGAPPPATYYECLPAAGCQRAFVSLTNQVQNPVALFAADNNGIIIRLPGVSGPRAEVSGSLVFGIGTQSNNGLGSATVYPVNSAGNFLYPVSYKNQSFADGYIDSGSNGNYFSDGAIPVCPDSRVFYCPANTSSLTASVQTAGKVSVPVQFSVTNADQLFSNPSDFVLPDLAGPNPDPQGFTWGLPFFFGRSVYVAVTSQQTPAGPGPYWAY